MERISSLEDPRVAGYRNLPDRTLRGENIFIAEGKLVVLRLLDSPYQVESVLAADIHAEQMAKIVGDRAPLYVATEELVQQIVGYPFHRGVLALGRRPAHTPTWSELLEQFSLSQDLRLVVLPAINQPENLGLIFRSACALGLDGVLLGPQTVDPLSRRVLRLSMGGVLHIRWARTEHLVYDLRQLGQRWQVVRVAAVVDSAATPLEQFCWPSRAAVLMGNEFEGLPAYIERLCDARLTIPMHNPMDSLNVGVAAGIFLYAMTRSQSLGTVGPMGEA
ncbi:MAG: RNA methyltransferase [Thermoguttaceae bacterium]|nr:RNA methyltransferase [Thermoguttaceae bacterium]